MCENQVFLTQARWERRRETEWGEEGERGGESGEKTAFGTRGSKSAVS